MGDCVVELKEEAAKHGLKRLRKIKIEDANAYSYVEDGYLYIAEKEDEKTPAKPEKEDENTVKRATSEELLGTE